MKLTSKEFRSAQAYEHYLELFDIAMMHISQEVLDRTVDKIVGNNNETSKAFDDVLTTGTGMYEVKHIYPSGFIKLDSGKRRLSLIEPQFIQSLGDVITFGAEKYAPNNWRLCEDTSRYKDALLRHIYAYLSGEQNDQETGLAHLSHASCNLMFLQYFDNLNKDQQ
jgi:hypothetical protein